MGKFQMKGRADIRMKDKEITELAKANSRWDHKKIILLSFAVALSVFVLFSAFSIAKGKIAVDTVKNIRESGNAVAVYLENASKRQYDQMIYPDYIEDYGWQYSIGDWQQEGKFLASCKVVDQTVWEKMIRPAYDHIIGNYPKSENDIMMSRSLLKKLGISNPQTGMEISAQILFKDWSVNGGEELTEKFTLSGYYTDYIDSSLYIPTVYFSEKYLDMRQIPRFPAKLALTVKSELFSGDQLEKKLYRDIELDNAQQQFVATDSAGMKSITQFIGGYGTAIACSVILLASVYLLIYNVLSISLAKDMNNFGLLMVVGLTRKQLKKMVFRQNIIILLSGIMGGAFLSTLVGIFVFPGLFENLFLKQYGKLEVQMVFYPQYLIGAVVVSGLMLLSASKYILSKLKNISPLNAYRYQAKEISSRKERKSIRGASICKMAWYNLWNSKRKFIITVVSLFMGCETIMLAGFIMNGTNLTNEFSQSPDFEIGTQKEAVENYLFPYKNTDEEQTDQNSPLFDESVVQKVIELPEIEESSLHITYGCYASYDYSEDYIQPIENMVYENSAPNNGMTIQVLDDQSIDLLDSYAKKSRQDIDFDALRAGSGIIVLHKHGLSETLEADAAKMKGKPAHVFPADTTGQNGVEFICSGYLDTTAKGFPELNMSWDDESFHYFLISEKGYERLGMLKQIFNTSVDAKKGKETAAAEKLAELVQNENNGQEDYNIYYLSRTADKIREAESYMEAGMDVMCAFSLSLLLLGVVNYINIILANSASRRSEFAVMCCIGMTRKQLRGMLIMEGIYYWNILQVLLLTAGEIINVGAGMIIRNNLSYFTFTFPFKEWIAISVVTLILCICIPQIMYIESTLENRQQIYQS